MQQATEEIALDQTPARQIDLVGPQRGGKRLPPDAPDPRRVERRVEQARAYAGRENNVSHGTDAEAADGLPHREHRGSGTQ